MSDQKHHQLFIIARVGQHYRSLAAVDHSRLFGVSAVARGLRLVRIFSDPSNRLALQQELLFAEQFYQSHPSPADVAATQGEDSDDNASPGPFPFIATCLIAGASADPDIGASQGIMQIPFNIAYDGWDNDCGATVLDISDLNAVRYCFLAFGTMQGMAGMHGEKQVDLDAPLSAWNYLLGYYNRSRQIVQHNVSVINALESLPLVSLAALSSVWPTGGWSNSEESSTPGSGAGQNILRGPSSLVLLSIKTLVEEIMQTDSPDLDLALLEQPLRLPNFGSAMRGYLFNIASTVSQSPNRVQLLQVAFSGESHVDLSRFTNLSSQDLKLVLHHPMITASVTAISLPIGISSSAKDIAAALPPGGIAELYCLGNSNISAADTFTTLYETGLVTRRLATHQLFDAGRLMRPYLSLSSSQPPRLPNGQPLQIIMRLPIDAIYADDMRTDLAAMFLGDALLTPSRFVTGLYNFFRIQTTCNLFKPQDDMLRAVLALTSAPSLLWPRDGGEISPLPVQLLHAASETSSNPHLGIHADARVVRDMAPGSWTLLLVKSIKAVKRYPLVFATEAQRKLNYILTYRAGFVRPKTQIPGKAGSGSKVRGGDFELFNVKGYLESVRSGLSDGLEELQKSLQEFVDGEFLSGAERKFALELQDLGEMEAVEMLQAATG